MNQFIAFVLDLCCSATQCDRETILNIKKQINDYLDKMLNDC